MYEPAKLIDAGIDYIRVTSQDRQQKGRMLDFYREIRVADQRLGYKEQTGGAFGFMGKKCRHALYGDKEDWAMVQASGQAAKRSLRLAGEGTQATRIDLQLTYWVGEGEVENTIRRAYNDACEAPALAHRPIRVNMIEARHKAQTVYLGSRASDVFFRIYDKYEESGKAEYKGCVRFELELKGRMAKALWQRWIDGTSTLASALATVINMLADRGVAVPCPDLENQDIARLKPEKTALDGTLAWLQNQVAPTVRRLVGEFGYITPFRILFESALTDLRTHRIMRSLSVVWGS